MATHRAPACPSCGSSAASRVPTIRAEPCVVDLDVRGETVRWDVLGMRVLGPHDDPSTAAPNFPRRNPAIGKLTLETTHRCNLRCAYCFVREQYDDGQDMELATAQRAFLRLLPADRDLAVTFFGGEPLMAWSLLSEFVPWARGVAQGRQVRDPKTKRPRPQRVRFHVTTNGTLLTPARVDFLRRYGFSLIVSLDGPAETHNTSRPVQVAGDGRVTSYDMTRGGLAILREAGISRRTTIRATYAGGDWQFGNDEWLVERLAHLNELCRNGLAANVSIEPAWASCQDIRCVTEHSPSGDLYVEKWLEPAYWAAAEWYVRETREGRPPRFFHFDKFLDRIRKRVPQPSECGGGFGVVSVAPDGTICACHRETGTAIGHVDRGIDEAARARWLDNRYFARQGCIECHARNVCGGGCRMDSLLHLGDITKPCPWECEFKKLLLRIAIWIDRELTR